ncbi:uncharacterized protein [Watersipora subatra]|uniref:uncharacterized protein n=1 Tax=Watersipora subatra TaxID=2589382 RepID=UPI00355C513F
MDSHTSRRGKAKATKRKISEENVKDKKAATRSSTSSQRGKADAKKRRVLFEDVKDKKELYIMDQDLSEGLPPVLHNLNTLNVLSLGRCKIKAIPKSLASLTGLTEFQLFTNDFSEGLPEAVCGLTSLTTLKIYDNKLTDLPDSLNVNCIDLDVSKAEKTGQLLLHSLARKKKKEEPKAEEGEDEEFGDEDCFLTQILSRLTQLKDLDISVNNIENVPKCVFKLANLQKLTIDSEKLKIDKEILSLPHLTKIELKGYQPRVVRGHKDIRKICENPGRSSAQSSEHNSAIDVIITLAFDLSVMDEKRN